MSLLLEDVAQQLLGPQSRGDMPGQCVVLHTAHAPRSGEGREVPVHAKDLPESGLMIGGWSLGEDEVDGHAEYTVTIGGAFATKKMPACQRGPEFCDVWRAVELVREDHCPGLITNVSKNHLRVWFHRGVGRCWCVVGCIRSGSVA